MEKIHESQHFRECMVGGVEEVMDWTWVDCNSSIEETMGVNRGIFTMNAWETIILDRDVSLLDIMASMGITDYAKRSHIFQVNRG